MSMSMSMSVALNSMRAMRKMRSVRVGLRMRV